jgi:hypothetical protein
MAEDKMRYDDMVRDALRGVVRSALSQAAKRGLPGDHHFYISFRTRAPGVDLDDDLRAKHPDVMTIVLQHRFWDLTVDDDGFEVTLTFNRIPKYLRVPWSALVQFHDPSVNFGLSFEPPAAAEARPERGKALEGAPKPGLPAKGKAKPAAPTAAKPHAESGKKAPEGGGAVVSIDAFRKKTD